MTRRDPSLSTALCASIIAHGILAYATFEISTRQLADVRLPGFPRHLLGNDFIEVDPPSGPRVGAKEPAGLAANSSPGEESLRAREAPQDQTMLSRDPAGPGRVGELPSWSLAPRDDATAMIDAAPRAPPAVARVPVLPEVTETAYVFGAGESIVTPPLPAGRTAAALAIPNDGPVAPARVAEAPVAPPAPIDAPIARSNQPAADPAPMSDSESDAFSAVGGVEFRDGKMEARLGRSFKSVRPRLSFAAQLDLLSISQPRIVLKIAIDAKGNVTAVDVVRSSGSNQVDQPVKIAMYQWWFEPLPAPGGRAMGETFLFPISWH